MPKLPKTIRRRFGPLSTALLVWDVWKRIPPKQRRMLLAQARKHGPRLAKQAYKARRRSKRK
jgi:hypothetical protein